MIRRLLAATALAAMIASPALATQVQFDPAHNKVDIDTVGAVPVAPASMASPTPAQVVYGSSGVAATTGTAVSNTASAATPALIPHRDAYLVLAGTGAATFTVLFSTDAANYYPEAGGVNGGSPIITNQVAYDGSSQNGIRIPFHTDEYGVTAKVKPGTVTGTVTYSLEQ